jgi:hypothetical protein
MAVTRGAFRTGEKTSITDGRQQIQFDSPSDFADWLAANSPEPEVLARWQWTTVRLPCDH